MTSKLVQKSLFKSTQTFEIIDDAINVTVKSAFKEEKLTVMLAVLNLEPVISDSTLDFTSRVNNEPLISLYLGKPNPGEFNGFVNFLKERIQTEYQDFAGIKPVMPPGMENNVFEEPVDFDAPPSNTNRKSRKAIRVDELKDGVNMLREYIGDDDLEPLIAAMESIVKEPDNTSHLTKMLSEFQALGPRQGAVLTYAPYIGILMTDDGYRP